MGVGNAQWDGQVPVGRTADSGVGSGGIEGQWCLARETWGIGVDRVVEVHNEVHRGALMWAVG